MSEEKPLYKNFYRLTSDWNRLSAGEEYYESLESAKKSIYKDTDHCKFAFTAIVAHIIVEKKALANETIHPG